VLTAVVVTVLVVGVVSISALLVKASFQAEALEVRIGELRDGHEVLAREVAVLSSPSRVQAWARMHGLDRPDQTPIILRLPPEGEPGRG
jgi:cell division protein FtsL